MSLIIFIALLGLVFWALSYLPIGEPFTTIIKVLFVIIAIGAVLQAFGIATGLNLK